jgi:hypothetical protein
VVKLISSAPAEDNEASEESEVEEGVEELIDVDKPPKERQKALGKAKQQLYHMTNMLIHSEYYSVLMNWSGWSSKRLTPIKSLSTCILRENRALAPFALY